MMVEIAASLIHLTELLNNPRFGGKGLSDVENVRLHVFDPKV